MPSTVARTEAAAHPPRGEAPGRGGGAHRRLRSSDAGAGDPRAAAKHNLFVSAPVEVSTPTRMLAERDVVVLGVADISAIRDAVDTLLGEP
jgi:hypothetical protein